MKFYFLFFFLGTIPWSWAQEKYPLELYDREVLYSIRSWEKLTPDELSAFFTEVDHANKKTHFGIKRVNQITNNPKVILGSETFAPKEGQYSATCREVRKSVSTLNYFTKKMKSLTEQIKKLISHSELSAPEDELMENLFNELSEITNIMEDLYPREFDRVDRVGLYTFEMVHDLAIRVKEFEVNYLLMDGIEWIKERDRVAWNEYFAGFNLNSPFTNNGLNRRNNYITNFSINRSPSIVFKRELTPIEGCYKDRSFELSGKLTFETVDPTNEAEVECHEEYSLAPSPSVPAMPWPLLPTRPNIEPFPTPPWVDPLPLTWTRENNFLKSSWESLSIAESKINYDLDRWNHPNLPEVAMAAPRTICKFPKINSNLNYADLKLRFESAPQ
jgi:hypothetical protein